MSVENRMTKKDVMVTAVAGVGIALGCVAADVTPHTAKANTSRSPAILTPVGTVRPEDKGTNAACPAGAIWTNKGCAPWWYKQNRDNQSTSTRSTEEKQPHTVGCRPNDSDTGLAGLSLFKTPHDLWTNNGVKEIQGLQYTKVNGEWGWYPCTEDSQDAGGK